MSQNHEVAVQTEFVYGRIWGSEMCEIFEDLHEMLEDLDIYNKYEEGRKDDSSDNHSRSQGVWL